MIDFKTLFSTNLHTPSQDALLDSLLNSESPIRKVIIDYAKMSDQEWANIKTLKSIDGELFHLEGEQEEYLLRTSPGDIDYNIFYQNPNAYQEPTKATILLACLKETLAKTSPAYAFLFEHILVRYHTYAGINNENFKKLIKQEIQEYDMSQIVTEEHVNNFLALFETKWAEHLRNIHNKAIEGGGTPVDIMILTSDDSNSHKAVCETLVSELSARGNSIKIINESLELGHKAPLLALLGLSESCVFTQIKQQANDEMLYQALNVLNERFAPFIRDYRMDVLRKKTVLCNTIISLNTSAHAARLIADGKVIVFDTFDTGLINKKLIQLARHQIKYNLTGLKFLLHPPKALIKNEHGSPIPVYASEAFYLTQYAVQPIKNIPLRSFKSDVYLQGERLSVLAFGDRACIGKASRLLKILISNDDYPEEPLQQRDIVLLAGTDYQTVIQELRALLDPDACQVTEKKITYHGIDFTVCSIAYNAQKTVHIWSSVSKEVMYALSQISDHFILSPTSTSAAQACSWRAQGVIVYYDAKCPSEKGNIQLLTPHGAGIIYDSTPLKQCCIVLREKERVQLEIDPVFEQYPTVVDTVTQVLSNQESPKLRQEHLLLPPPVEDGPEDIYAQGIRAAATRVINAQKGILEKDSDRVITLAPTVTREQLESFFTNVVDFLKVIPAESIDSVGTSNEDFRILQFIDLLRDTEQQLLITEASVSIFPGKVRDKTLIGWTGFPAMNAAIHDSTGVCNFDIPILNMLFVLWDKLFCQPRCLTESDVLSKISTQYPISFLQAHPIVKQFQSAINEDIKKCRTTTSEEISRKYFGSRLSDEDRLLAEKLGALASKIFVREFYHPTYAPVFYFSINKLKEFDKPILATDSNGWNEELPLLRQLSLANKVRFKSVTQSGLVTEVPLDQVSLVRNRGFNDNVLQDREYYTCGMPSLIEWSIYSSQPPRPATPVSVIKDMLHKWRFFAHRKALSRIDSAQTKLKKDEDEVLEQDCNAPLSVLEIASHS
ncbi:MAG: hypothetical protein P1U61_08780 [Legionellaceae bacterium]|nr:hypothetical protein [Legionellaceae bacterium]